LINRDKILNDEDMNNSDELNNSESKFEDLKLNKQYLVEEKINFDADLYNDYITFTEFIQILNNSSQLKHDSDSESSRNSDPKKSFDDYKMDMSHSPRNYTNLIDNNDKSNFTNQFEKDLNHINDSMNISDYFNLQKFNNNQNVSYNNNKNILLSEDDNDVIRKNSKQTTNNNIRKTSVENDFL